MVPWKWCEAHSFRYLYGGRCPNCIVEGTMSEGLKYDDGKPRMELLSTIALRATAAVLTFGAKKYQAHNWRKGIELSRLLGAAMRHLTSFLGGEDTDSETGLSHLDHAACCVMFAQELWRTHPQLDDRWRAKDYLKDARVAPLKDATDTHVEKWDCSCTKCNPGLLRAFENGTVKP